MTSREHENYAKDLLLSLSDDSPETENVNFVLNPTQSRNAARAMTAILCHRLIKKSKHRPIHKMGTTYEWKQGVFNCRNIADRDYLWTNLRRNFANEIHDAARTKAVAYLLACSSPLVPTLFVWSIPEPVVYESLSSLVLKEGGQDYTIQITTDKQRIEHYAGSPDLREYFHGLPLSRHELLVLQESRDVDASVRQDRAIAKELEDSDDVEGDSAVELDTKKVSELSPSQWSGGLHQTDPILRQKVERVAIEVTTACFTQLGYLVDSVEHDNVGWDLDAVLENRKLKLEVKGLSGSEIVVELTPNEFVAMREHRDLYRLCVVAKARTEPSVWLLARVRSVEES
jgi:hypothetical protein